MYWKAEKILMIKKMNRNTIILAFGFTEQKHCLIADRGNSREKSNVLIWEQEAEKKNLKGIQACKLPDFFRK